MTKSYCHSRRRSIGPLPSSSADYAPWPCQRPAVQSIHTNCLPPTEQTQFCVLVCRMLATAAELMRYDNTRLIR